MASRRVLALAAALVVLLFLLQKDIVSVFAPPAAPASKPAELSQRDLDVISQRVSNQSSKLESSLRGLMREEQAKLRFDIVRDITSELKSYVESLKATMRDSIQQLPALASNPAKLQTEDDEQEEEDAPTTPKAVAQSKVYVEISSLITENCLDTNPMDSGTVVRTWNCHHGDGGDFQQYSVTKSGQIRHPSGLCITTYQETRENVPAPVKLEPCSDKSPAHHWILQRYGGKAVQLKNKATGRCLLAPRRGDVSEPVLAVMCEPRCAQFWAVGNTNAPFVDLPAASCKPDPIPQIMSMGGNECLDANPLRPDTVIKTFGCHGGKGGPYQSFVISKEGKIKIKSTMCADGENPAAVKLRECSDAPSQSWQLNRISSKSKFMWIRNVANGLCMRLSYTKLGGERSPVTLVNCSRSCGQLWHAAIQQAPTTLAAPRKGPTKLTSLAPPKPRSKDRIFCWVLTHPRAHATRAKAINNTWGRECTYLVFITSQHDPTLPTVVADLPGPDTRDALWAKSKFAFMYAYKHYLDKADWFCKFDDDTLVIMPYLREFLAGYKPTDPHYFGRRLYYGGSDDERMSYYSGGGGYLVSRNVLERLGKAVTADPNFYVGPWNVAEDFGFGQTLHKLGVNTEDTRDETGAHRFSVLGITAEHTMTRERNEVPWYWTTTKDSREGPACCSTRWITSHYEPAEAFYALDEMRRIGCENEIAVWPYLEIPAYEPSES